MPDTPPDTPPNHPRTIPRLSQTLSYLRSDTCFSSYLSLLTRTLSALSVLPSLVARTCQDYLLFRCYLKVLVALRIDLFAVMVSIAFLAALCGLPL